MNEEKEIKKKEMKSERGKMVFINIKETVFHIFFLVFMILMQSSQLQ